MSWERVRGHDDVRRAFAGAWRRDRLGQAYLFVGPTGVGKHTFARELARALLCETRTRELEACERCAGCALADAGTHPDLFLAARPEDAVDLPIDLIRDLIEHLGLKPARGRRKVAILDDADDLSPEAANAFLKTLEEPPPGSLLILVGGPSPDRQFPTVLSRCQVVAFRPLPNAVLFEHLRSQGIDDPARIDRLVRMAGGSIGQALALNDDALWQFRATLLQAICADPVDAFGLATHWNRFVEEAGKEAGQRRRRAAVVLRLLIGMLQDAVRASHGVPPLVADGAETERLKRLAGRLGPERLLAWIDRAAEADLQVDRKVQLELIVDALADVLAR